MIQPGPVTIETLILLTIGVALGGAGAAAVFYRRTAARERTIRRQIARETSLKARFDDLFERTTEIVVIHDRRGRVSTMNRAAEQLSGYSREEIRSIDAAWLFNEPYLDTIQRMLREGADCAPATFRAELLTRKGARVPIDAHAGVLVGDGQVVGVTLIARNVAEREQFNAQLRQAQKMEAVGRLATGIAHDFNNLVTVLLGYSEELGDAIALDSPLRKPVDELRRVAERASGLTQQLLAFSRRHVTVSQSVDLNATITNMRDMLRRLLGAEISLDIRLQENVGLVTADPVQISQIVMNLAVNGRDAMPKGGTLTIGTARVEVGAGDLDALPGTHIVLTVRDNGMGMTPEVQRQLFDPFFTTKEPGQGTGLGLSMVSAIVRQSGGHVTVASEIGKGSTFHVYFPMAPANDAPAQAAPAPIGARSPATGSGVILLAEDDRAVRQLLSDDLRRRGFHVLEAENGLEALQICRQYDGTIDVLVTDVVMPTMNGVDLVAAARPLRPSMPVLFVSGHPERAGVGLDVNGPDAANLLMKPFTPETLVKRIQDVLARNYALRGTK